MIDASLLVLAAAPAVQQPTLRLPEPAPVEERLEAIPLDGAVDETDSRRVFLEIHVPDGPCWQGQLVHVDLRFGIPTEFLRYDLIPLFRRTLDLPVLIEAPWLDQDPQAAALQTAFAPRIVSRKTVACNGRVASARSHGNGLATRGDESYDIFSLDGFLVARSIGTTSLQGARLRYAYATAFEEDFVFGRTPTGRRDAFVTAPALELQVRPLPEEGRPVDFSGAVGRFTLEAEVDVRSVRAGESLKLTLRLEGDGDLSTCTPPDLRRLEGLDVLGTLDDHGHAVRTIVVDVAPSSPSTREIPALSFAFFDTHAPAGYRIASSAPIDLRVTEAAPIELPAIAQGAGFAAPGSLLVLLATGALFGAAIVAVGIALSRRRRRT